jgi:hypothetical protein
MIEQKYVNLPEPTGKETKKTNNQQQINWQWIWLKTDVLNINISEGWMMTVLYLRGLNILWLLNWQLQPYLPRSLLRSIRYHAVYFFAFPSGSVVASWKTIEPLAALLLHTNCPSAVPVKFHNYNDNVTRVAGRFRVPTIRSKDILLQAKGDHLCRIHSDQMVLQMIRLGRLVW